jgi:peroxiredoxin (alkyl hydroperoxide reductase subunit C)
MEPLDLHIGSTIPDLELHTYYKGAESVLKTSEYQGTWKIFFFYPADFTFVCPTELEELALMYPDFQKEQAEIFSISTDTVFAHKAWHDTSPAISKITFPMVADPAGKLCRLFKTYIPDEGLSLRGTFIIDPDGVLITIEINDNSIGRSGKELLRKLRAAKFIREHGHLNVCPASWEPGDDTLTPGMDLVGKI